MGRFSVKSFDFSPFGRIWGNYKAMGFGMPYSEKQEHRLGYNKSALRNFKAWD